ncbi:MAG: tetratricopeptide repeat protein [Pseudomonadota bacterium]
MSNPDSFIEEVNEEVRRDRLYGLLGRYGWIGVLVIVLIVGGAAFSEYRKAQAKAQAEALGDGMLAALSQEDRATRVEALAALEPPTPLSAAVLALMTAAEQFEAGDAPAAIATLEGVSVNGDVPEVYRQLAQFKAITLQGSDTPVETRRQALEAMAQPGNRLRLLATEQLALIDIETGETTAAVARYQAILSDAEVSADLQQRALQVIVALGGEPELADTIGLDDAGMSQSGN